MPNLVSHRQLQAGDGATMGRSYLGNCSVIERFQSVSERSGTKHTTNSTAASVAPGVWAKLPLWDTKTWSSDSPIYEELRGRILQTTQGSQ